MAGFRRAQLRGSDELFRPTAAEPIQQELGGEPEAVATPEPETKPQPTTMPAPGHMKTVPPEPAGEPTLELDVERPVLLSGAELELLAEAVQHLKFPGKSPTRPSIDDFERLEELRQKLLKTL